MIADPADAQLVRTFVGRQKKLVALARAWLQLPQVRDSNVPLGGARALLEAMDDNLAPLIRALR